MGRKLFLVLVLAVGMNPLGAWALGLGDIRTTSVLNQNFDGAIELLSVPKGELEYIKVELASPEAFRRAGVDRPYILTKLKFEMERLEDGSTVIKVTSKDPVREPFLNFLIEVNWPKGRLVREYTVLLDPPVTLGRKPAPVEAPVATTAARETEVQPVRRAAETPAYDRPSPTEYGPVKSSDTLWGIAKKVKHRDVGMQQMMISLQHANPQAFARNNINNLKRGEILRIPSREEVMEISRGEARDSFKSQMAAWRADRAPREEVATAETPAPAPEAAAEASPASPVTEGEPVVAEAELKVVTPRPEGEGEAGSAEDAPAEQRIVRLEQDLLLSQEEAESARQEGAGLKSQLGELEDQMADMQRLLALKDEQLARMQANIAEAQTTAPVATTPAPVVAEKKPEPEITKPAPKKPAPKKPAAKKKPAPEPSLLDKLFSNTTMVGVAVAVVVILLALIWVFMSRRKSDTTDFQESILVSTGGEEEGESEMSGIASSSEETDETSFLSDFSPSDIDALQDETGEADPIAEADVYIAYGRYQQANELIHQAIDREPERYPLYFKLFEILHAMKNAEEFVALAEENAGGDVEQSDPPAWRKVLSMGKDLEPGHALFAGAAALAVTAAAAETQKLDVDSLAAELGMEENSELGVEVDSESLSELESLDLSAFESEGEEGEEELGDLEGLDLGELASELETKDTGETTAIPDAGEVTAEIPAAEPEGVEATDQESSLEFDLGLDLGAEAKLEEPTLDDDDMGALEGLDLSELPDDLSEEDMALELPDLAEAEEEPDSALVELEPEQGQAEVEVDSISLDDLDLEDEDEAAIEQSAADIDEVATKLDLARAYVDMGDAEGARDILEEVMAEGDDSQKQQAREIMDQLA
jgi:pilus assembly protein FimV